MKRKLSKKRKQQQYQLLLAGIIFSTLALIALIVSLYITQKDISLYNLTRATIPTNKHREDFSSDNGSTTISNQISGVSSSKIENGRLNIDFKPSLPVYGSHAVTREFSVDMSKTAYFSVRTRMEKQLMGQDMYSKFTFYPNGKPLSIILGVNGEQHWKTTYYINPALGSCVPKDTDDEFFIKVPSEVFPNATDTRLQYPNGYKKPYTEWTTYSFRYDPPSSSNSSGRLRFYVDNQEVSVKAIDAPQLGVLPTTTKAFNVLGANSRVTFTAELFTDGTEYAYPGNKFGQRGRGCYATKVPAIPSKTVYPAKFTNTSGTAYKQSWMTKYDAVAKVFFDTLREKQPYPISTYKAASQISPAGKDTIGNANPATLPYIYDHLVKNNPTLKQQVIDSIWRGIYAGTLDFETAVMIQILPLPDSRHTQWQYIPSGTRDKWVKQLNDINQLYSSKHLFRRWPMQIMYTQGGTADMIHFGYLSPEDMVGESVWNYMSEEEKKSIIKPSQPTTGRIMWDFVEVKN